MGDLQTALEALQATPPEGSNDKSTPEPTPPTPEPEPQSHEPSDQVVNLPDGKAVKVSEILEWKAGAMKSADYTQKTQQIAERDRQLSAREQDLQSREHRLAALEDALREREIPGGNPQAQPDFSGLDEMAPGLGKAFQTVFASNAELKQEIATVRAAQKKAETEAAKYLEDASADEKMVEALKAFQDDPSANLDDMRAYAEANNLGPEHLELVYEGLYGFYKGQLKGRTVAEQELAKRRANVPAPMGGSNLGIQGATPQEVVGRAQPTSKRLRHTSFQEVRDRAKNDPRAPKVSFEG